MATFKLTEQREQLLKQWYTAHLQGTRHGFWHGRKKVIDDMYAANLLSDGELTLKGLELAKATFPNLPAELEAQKAARLKAQLDFDARQAAAMELVKPLINMPGVDNVQFANVFNRSEYSVECGRISVEKQNGVYVATIRGGSSRPVDLDAVKNSCETAALVIAFLTELESKQS